MDSENQETRRCRAGNAAVLVFDTLLGRMSGIGVDAPEAPTISKVARHVVVYLSLETMQSLAIYYYLG